MSQCKRRDTAGEFAPGVFVSKLIGVSGPGVKVSPGKMKVYQAPGQGASKPITNSPAVSKDVTVHKNRWAMDDSESAASARDAGAR
jgi:hypothetical protein